VSTQPEKKSAKKWHDAALPCEFGANGSQDIDTWAILQISPEDSYPARHQVESQEAHTTQRVAFPFHVPKAILREKRALRFRSVSESM